MNFMAVLNRNGCDFFDNDEGWVGKGKRDGENRKSKKKNPTKSTTAYRIRQCRTASSEVQQKKKRADKLNRRLEKGNEGVRVGELGDDRRTKEMKKKWEKEKENNK